MLINARSIVKKVSDIEVYVETEHPDILLITESWLKEEISNNEIQINGYNILRRDRIGSIGGGCLIYYAKALNVKEISLPNNVINSEPYIQTLWMQISTHSITQTIGLCYNSPSSSLEEKTELNSQIKEACSIYKDVIICGDFNYPNINWETLHSTGDDQLFLDTTLDCFLKQHVEEPTRNKNILDLVLSTNGVSISNVSIDDPFGTSDHNTVKFSLQVSQNSKETWKTTYYDYRNGKYKKFAKFLSKMKWDTLFKEKDVDTMVRYLAEILEKGTKKYIPLRYRSHRRKQPIWLNNNILKISRKKRFLWRKYKKSKLNSDYIEYKKVLNSLSKSIKVAKWKAEDKISKNIKKDPKAFFKYVKEKLTNKDQVHSLKKPNGELTDTDGEIVDLLNNYFATVFSPTENAFEIPTEVETPELPIVDKVMIEKLLSEINPNKSMGPDNMHPTILKNLSKQLAYPITIIFNESLKSSKVPNIWKQANVSPIFKKGNKNLVENYRPISLTSQLCRILEKILKNIITEYLNNHELIHPSQHGFLKNKSCLTNLLTFLENVTKDVDKGLPVDVIYLDFMKAFDKVPHKKLIEKMRALQINENIINWVTNWLTDRQQRVVIRGNKSSWLPVTSGVPQGSVLGPLLFLIYINDLEDNINSKVLKFADDTKIFRCIETPADSDELQQDLNKIAEWSALWQMPFNTGKCHSLHIGHSNKKQTYHLSGEIIHQTDTERDLGVIIQDNLDQSQQIGNVVKKANQILGLISRTYTNKTKKNILPLYKSLVRPHLEFAMQAWRPYKQKDINIIESVQRRATRMIPELTDLDYSSRLKNTNLISLEMRRLRADLIEVFKIMKELEGIKIEDFFELQKSCARGHSLKISKPFSRLDIRKYFFSQRVITEWNNLTEDVVNSNTINEFKSKIQKYFEDNRSSYISPRLLPAPVLKIG